MCPRDEDRAPFQTPENIPNEHGTARVSYVYLSDFRDGLIFTVSCEVLGLEKRFDHSLPSPSPGAAGCVRVEAFLRLLVGRGQGAGVSLL